MIFDSHENVSKQILSKKWLGSLFVRKTISSIYRMFEKTGIFFFNSVISVTPEIVQFLSPKKGLLIRNYPLINIISSSKEVSKYETFTFIYAGGLSEIRGIREVCEAISLTNLPVQLLLIGKWENPVLQEKCLAYSKEKIKHLGFLSLQEVFHYMKKSHVGIATLYPEENYLNSLPIKVFEYMGAEIPVIMSDFEYWREIFYDVGVFVDPKSVDDLKSKFEQVYQQYEVYREKGITGKEQVLSKYSWDNEAKKLIDLYKSLSN